jgi:hypothetical protein
MSQGALDAARVSPHPIEMAGDAPKPPPNDREAKLAAALRANLRRRKGKGGAAKAPKQDKSCD